MILLLQFRDFLLAVLQWAKWLVAICAIPLTLGGAWLIVDHLAFGAELSFPLWKTALGTVGAALIGGLCWPREGEL